MGMNCPECDNAHPLEDCGRYKVIRIKRKGPGAYPPGYLAIYDTKTGSYTWSLRSTSADGFEFHQGIHKLEQAYLIVESPHLGIWSPLPERWEYINWEPLEHEPV